MNTLQFLANFCLSLNTKDMGVQETWPVRMRISPPVKYNIISPHAEQRMGEGWISG